MRLIIFLCALTTHSSVLAQLWVPYWYHPDFTYLYDPISIKRDGVIVQVSTLRENNGVKVAGNGKQYLSTTATEELNCKEKTSRIVEMTSWTRPTGNGEEIYSFYIEDETGLDIPLGTIIWELFLILCHKISESTDSY